MVKFLGQKRKLQLRKNSKQTDRILVVYYCQGDEYVTLRRVRPYHKKGKEYRLEGMKISLAAGFTLASTSAHTEERLNFDHENERWHVVVAELSHYMTADALLESMNPEAGRDILALAKEDEIGRLFLEKYIHKQPA